MPMTIQPTNSYHHYSLHWTALPFSVIAWLLYENDALPMWRLLALKMCILKGHRVRCRLGLY